MIMLVTTVSINLLTQIEKLLPIWKYSTDSIDINRNQVFLPRYMEELVKRKKKLTCAVHWATSFVFPKAEK